MQFPTPTIFHSPAKKIVGMHLSMSLEENKVGQLWQSFMPRKREIAHSANNNLISLAIYPKNHFLHFSTTNFFEKWAAIEVENFDDVPQGMETLIIHEGLYAVFQYQGLNTDTSIFQYIFGTWLPSSAYELDQRPHFEILGEKYKNNDPESEEEIWIPIRSK